jgi:hypothetical protein
MFFSVLATVSRYCCPCSAFCRLFSFISACQAVSHLMQQQKQARPQQCHRQQRLQPLVPAELASQQQQQQQQQQRYTSADGSNRAHTQPAALQTTANTTAAGAEAASSLGPDYTGDDSQLVLHDLTSAVLFAPRSFINNEGTTFAPSNSQQHRRLSVAIPTQVRAAARVQCCTANARRLSHTDNRCNSSNSSSNSPYLRDTACTFKRSSTHTSR